MLKNDCVLEVQNISVTYNRGKKAKNTLNEINFKVKKGELVAIVGCSGAGKSTILHCMCGYLPPKEGRIYIRGVDLYKNFKLLKRQIGHVPQQNIIHENLTLYDTLIYTAKLRFPRGTSKEKQSKAVKKAIELVELEGKENKCIKDLSGGEKKRANIAVELVLEPEILFLDEPTSGLDPATEKQLMISLKEMTNQGKTIVFITHSILQLKLCDRIVFLGKDGKICYYGAYEDALKYFNVESITGIYHEIKYNYKKWNEIYKKLKGIKNDKDKCNTSNIQNKLCKKCQIFTLCKRYLKLTISDKWRLLLLVLQAPILVYLIYLVADGNQFEQYEMTKSLLFALSCCAFWIGILNAIQEVCKERSILKREYMSGLSLSSYVLSKILVLSILCLVQSFIVTGIFSVLIGLPGKGVITYSFLEFYITIFLSMLASTATGILVSSLFNNSDRVMTLAPILLLPQVLFSGLVFKLDGNIKNISNLIVCRWNMEGLGTIANLNNLPLRLQQQGVPIEHTAEDFFDFTSSHLYESWAILFTFTIVCLILTRVALIKIRREKF